VGYEDDFDDFLCDECGISGEGSAACEGEEEGAEATGDGVEG
jgi:hypothetical protein